MKVNEPDSRILKQLLRAIVDDDRDEVSKLLRAEPSLVRTPVHEAKLYDKKIFHWIYVGDTALHLAAAGYRVELVKSLIDAGAGADPNASQNHRQSGPLHYAADRNGVGPAWDGKRQLSTIELLVKAGAKLNAQDKNGATALHRAVRTRAAGAVRFLLKSGANPGILNKPGSTAFHLSVQDTGRGGSGAEEARTAQREIIEEFLRYGLSPSLKDGSGKSVLDWVRSDWVRELLV